MKMELRIEGKVIVIEAEGLVSVQLFEEKNLAEPVRRHDETPLETSQGVLEEENDDLFAKLVNLRKEVALASSVPNYVVFHDKTLREIVERLPETLQELGNISGVGQAKLEKYGDIFLNVIREHKRA